MRAERNELSSVRRTRHPRTLLSSPSRRRPRPDVASKIKRMAPASIWIRSRPWVVKLLETLPLLALLALFNVSGLRGVDYGFHWDEVDWQIEPVHRMVKSGILLPGSYIYPSFCKWLILLPA